MMSPRLVRSCAIFVTAAASVPSAAAYSRRTASPTVFASSLSWLPPHPLVVADLVQRVGRERRQHGRGDRDVDAIEVQRRIADVLVVHAEHGGGAVQPIEAAQRQHPARRPTGDDEHDLLDVIRLDVRIARLEPALEEVREARAVDLLGEHADRLADVVALARGRPLGTLRDQDRARERREHVVPRLRERRRARCDRGRAVKLVEHARQVVWLAVACAATLDDQRRQLLAEQRVERGIGERHAAHGVRVGGRRRQRAHVRAGRRSRPRRDVDVTPPTSAASTATSATV